MPPTASLHPFPSKPITLLKKKIFVLVIPTHFDHADPELATISSGDLASSIFLVSRPGVPRDRSLTVSGSLRFS